MPASAHQNIVLIGFMGSGKSSIGRLIAGRLGFQFVDTDAVVVERAGMDIPKVFARHGEAHFRKLETAVLESMAMRDRCVISTGGGVIVRPGNRTLLRRLGFVVWLTASEEVIYQRVSRNKRRPLLQTENPRETVAKLLESREPAYAETAQFRLDTTVMSRAAAADVVIAEARRAFSWQGPA